MRLLNKAEVLAFVRERRALFDYAGRDNPFACSAWVLHFIEVVAEEQWQFLVPECEGGEGVMLLYRRPDSGECWSAVTNFYASLFSPFICSISEPGRRSGALQTLVGELTGMRPRGAVVSLSPLDAAAADVKGLRRFFSESGWYVRSYPCFGNWYLPCAGLSFESYMAGRESRLFNTWRRKLKRFKAYGAGARLEVVRRVEDVPAAMDAYERVYARSWKEPESYGGFVRQWAMICAGQGWLRLGLAWLDEVPIAAQFWFVMNGRAYIFKLAYDEAYAGWSAGTLLSAHLFECVLDEDQVVEVDYLTGDDAYKGLWVSERRERIGFVVCNLRTFRGFVRAAREWLGQLSQRWRHR